MNKGYDRVEWGFLEGMMEKMGLATEWISLVMHCITSVSYTVSVNGFSSERFSPKGDCVKGFSALLDSAIQMGNLKGVKVCRGSPTATHLFFADDNIVFGDANEIGGLVLLDILRQYETVLGQKINLDKSQIFFSSNVSNNYCNQLVQMLRNENKNSELGARLLSQGGKEVFIKAVLQAIPTYSMSCFLLPKTLCTKLESIMSRFFVAKKLDS
ncbi:reverse transcriptase [Gossypium australe]|uniref:Reverse transcriptase n=1 Tax=Gossypium australe TaxID=47621 RepID=A0A5B6VI80_9ROSI|nr:reverse transcriptase [Gossypium australe]